MTQRAEIQGFTLIELLTTLAVLAILMVVAVPAATSISQSTRLRGAAEDVMGGMLLARSEAIRHNDDIRVSFKTGTQWCIGLNENGTACDCSTSNSCTITTKGVSQEKVVSYEDYQGVSLSLSGFSNLTYQVPQGTVTNNGTGTATFTIDGKSMGVQISTLLGRPVLCSDSYSKYPNC